jgi:CubicO group peptidase (beta-lactamase class C family)
LFTVLACAPRAGSTAPPPAPGAVVGAPIITNFQGAPAAMNATSDGTPNSAKLTWFITSSPPLSALTLSWGTKTVTLDSAATSYTVKPAATTTYTLSAKNSAGTKTAQTSVRVYDWTKLASDLSATQAADGVPGYSFVLLDKKGIWTSAQGGTYGGANQTISTQMPLASSTKLISAAAIMTLVDEGVLNLNTPVVQYLATAGKTQIVNAWNNDAYNKLGAWSKKGITMRMLLSHTSGLVGLGGPHGPGSADDQTPLCFNDTAWNLDNCMYDVATKSLVAAPATASAATFIYGGVDYLVAGYVATLLYTPASGHPRSWQDLVDQKIKTPLGMTTLTYDSVLNPNNPLQTCLMIPSGSTLPNPKVSGGALCSAGDYAKLLQTLLAGGKWGTTQVLQPGSVKELEKLQPGAQAVSYLFYPTPAYYPPYGPNTPIDISGYGLGAFLGKASLFTETIHDYDPNGQSNGRQLVEQKPVPADATRVIMDPGLAGAFAWIDNNLGTAAMVEICEEYTSIPDFHGFDLARHASAHVTCQVSDASCAQ